MKYIAYLILILCLLIPLGNSYAESTTPKASPTDSTRKILITGEKNEEQGSKIDDLKDRLATKVAELRKLQKQAITGTVKEVSVATMSIETKTKTIKIDLVDDLPVVQFIKGVRTKLSIEDIAENDIVTVFGSYDSTLDVLSPGLVFIQNTLPVRIHGIIKSIDSDGGTFVLSHHDGTELTIDVQSTTKTERWSSIDGITKSGFSKLAVEDKVHVTGSYAPKSTTTIKATKVVSLGSLQLTDPTLTPTAEPTQLASPSATPLSEKKTTPTKKPTIKPTPTESTQ